MHTTLYLLTPLTSPLTGIKDDRAVLLADAIKDLPYVESINIADNMLTDKGISAIIHAAVHIKNLREMNISQNKIGAALEY